MACNKCIWRDQCSMEETVCSYFESHSQDNLFSCRNPKEYFADLQDRSQDYMDILREPTADWLRDEG